MTRRNIALACGHPEGFATLHDPSTRTDAWCPLCEADVKVESLNCRTCEGMGNVFTYDQWGQRRVVQCNDCHGSGARPRESTANCDKREG